MRGLWTLPTLPVSEGVPYRERRFRGGACFSLPVLLFLTASSYAATPITAVAFSPDGKLTRRISPLSGAVRGLAFTEGVPYGETL